MSADLTSSTGNAATRDGLRGLSVVAILAASVCALPMIAVLLAALALLRPGHRGEMSGQGRSVYLLDTSASMPRHARED